MLVSEALDAAADLIEPEGAWTQGCLARASNWGEVSPKSDEAVCWCAEGAIEHVRQPGPSTDIYGALRDVLPDSFIYIWNDADDRTQAEVVGALRLAAAKAREEGK